MLTWHACERSQKHKHIYKKNTWIQINRCVSIVFVITYAKLVPVALREQWRQRRRLIFSSRLKLANKPNSNLIPPRHLNVIQKESNRTPPTTWPTFALNRRLGSCYPTPKCGSFRLGFMTCIFPLPVWSLSIPMGSNGKPDPENINIAVGISLISRLGVEKHAFEV